ncbi:MAG: type II secretion system F family protein, partial [Bacillota bacterium]
MLLVIALLVAGAVFLLLIPARVKEVQAGPWGWPQTQPEAPPPGRLVAKLADYLATTKVARDLAVSGEPFTLEELAARKLRLTAIALGGAALGLLLGQTNLALFGLVAALWAFQGPNLEVARKADARRAAVQKELPSFLFTLAVLTEAGLNLLPALDQYCRQSRSVLAEELKGALAEVQLGQSPALAFLNLAQHLDVRDFTFFVGALVQTLEKGTDGLSITLRAQAEAAWDKRRRRAQELGAKASVKLFLPLILFVLPAILAMAAGPA